ncbi:MAG TPA: hypothetical protein PK176_04275 [Acidobacteriota bacterium]|nr:hypothetical protein [Acidobacteriota bacterium]HQM62506.1 hypothetical protein [Acidobacteriota bacterium]
MARCDLHVHSYFSGKTNHVKLLEPMDSYNTPDRIYRTAKRRGMDFVTITDHDAIGGCLDFMRRHPERDDFFMSEEVSTRIHEFGYTLHVGVYGLTADDHAAMQPLRRDWSALLRWLEARGLFYTWNHPFYHIPTGPAGARLLELLLPRFPAYEGINACLPPRVNDAFADGCRARATRAGGAAPLVAGSDSHSMWRVAHTWTEAPGATLDAYFAALRAGCGTVHGNTGTFWGVFTDAMSVYLGYLRDIAVRNDAHQDWSAWKKLRNSFGWAGWLPVFTVGSLAYSLIQFRRFKRRAPAYRALWDGLAAPAETRAAPAAATEA